MLLMQRCSNCQQSYKSVQCSRHPASLGIKDHCSPLCPHCYRRRSSCYMCQKCKCCIVSLEKAISDLEDFKKLVSSSRSPLEEVRAPLKRSKLTSNEFGVLPDTARERPRSKLPRQKLNFQSKTISIHNISNFECSL